MIQNLFTGKKLNLFSPMSLITLFVYFKVFSFSLEVVLAVPVLEAGCAGRCHTDLLSQLLKVTNRQPLAGTKYIICGIQNENEGPVLLFKYD